MKATTTILAAVFTLSINVLFANNDGAAVIRETSSFHTTFAPGTPAEATFDEINDAAATAFNFVSATPNEADFSDAISETTIDFTTLAPVTHSEADFASDFETTNVSIYYPVSPSVADFSDGI